MQKSQICVTVDIRVIEIIVKLNGEIAGYGNIVPATSSGRIACVVFALFGAPLAIITIGGKIKIQ